MNKRTFSFSIFLSNLRRKTKKMCNIIHGVLLLVYSVVARKLLHVLKAASVFYLPMTNGGNFSETLALQHNKICVRNVVIESDGELLIIFLETGCLSLLIIWVTPKGAYYQVYAKKRWTLHHLTQKSPTSYVIANPDNPNEPVRTYHVSALKVFKQDKSATPVHPLRKRGRPRKTFTSGSSPRRSGRRRNQRGSL
ncbi:hypothetical protein AVEN_247092-1 [Araneus ventricosus]|uniref:Uncharacterized protein n=1 Tax=Araneus ventricosus TaxID=182803 RepID=A0A4Y2HR35_ARAVE|nr:hypothetical protein AVEN_247092-1 [Araneus ventricosus]